MDIVKLETLENSRVTGQKSIQKLQLGSMPRIKKSLARLANESLRPGADMTKIRCATYVINSLLNAHRVDVENRLERLEDLFGGEHEK